LILQHGKPISGRLNLYVRSTGERLGVFPLLLPSTTVLRSEYQKRWDENSWDHFDGLPLIAALLFSFPRKKAFRLLESDYTAAGSNVAINARGRIAWVRAVA
jgi:hypothetical protein